MIRPAAPADVPAIYQLIRELAEYERSLPHVTGTPEQLRAVLFGPEPAVFAHVADHEGEIAGFALRFLNFSTWQCQHGLHLEDLYVRPDLRRQGHGRRLLAALCLERGYGRLEWVVLDWNEPAIGFYRSLGAVSMDEWTTFRLAGPALAQMAAARGGG